MKPTKIVAVANAAAAASGGSKKAVLLRNLGKNDVVFGTKGNGRNEVFLQLLEEHAEQYVKSSKFEKMGLIQELIQDWKGNFYFLNPKTNELGMARENIKTGAARESCTSPVSTSSKLYTSVRRMMNYVVAKNNYQYVQSMPSSSSSKHPSSKQTSSEAQQRKRSISSSPQPPVASKSSSSKRKSSELPSKKSKKRVKTSSKKSTAAAARLIDAPPVASVTVPNMTMGPPATTTTTTSASSRMDTLSPIPAMGTSSKHQQRRAPMLVTPEPSPRIFQKVGVVVRRNSQGGQDASSALAPSMEGATFPIQSSSCTSYIDLPTTFAAKPTSMAAGKHLVRPQSTLVLSRNNYKRLPFDRKYVHRLEDTAIQTLMSLSTASWISEQEEEDYALFY